MQMRVDLFAGDLGREVTHRRVRHLVLGIMERTGRHHCRQRLLEIVDSIAGERRDHEGARKGQLLIGRRNQRQQLLARHQIDLVDHQDLLMRDRGRLVDDGLRLVVETLLGVEQHADEIGIMGAAPGRRHHGAIEPALRRENAGRVDQDDLRRSLDHDATDQRARGLHLARDDRDLGAHQRIDQRRLADIGGADQRDESAAGLRPRPGVLLSRHCCRR